MLKVLFPIHIDKWTSSIASKLREIVKNSNQGDVLFYAFSKPRTAEDRELAPDFWSHPQLSRAEYIDIALQKFNIVHHASATVANLAAAIAARARAGGRCKHVYTISIEVSRSDKFFRHTQISVRLADVLIANSQAVAESVRRQFGRSVDALIPNGVDTAFFAPEASNSATLTIYRIKRPYVLFSGALVERKRPEHFIQLARRMPELTFVMIGRSTSLTEHFLHSAPSNVRYLGLLPKGHARDLLGHAEALVFPSELEGLPNVVLEAISMGVPVLAQPLSSLPEIIQEGITGWLLPYNDLEGWVDGISGITNWTHEERMCYQAKARSIAAQQYSWSTYSARHLELYRDLCG